MVDKNPYDSPLYEQPQEKDRFWIGVLVGCLSAFVLMAMLIVISSVILFVAVDSSAPPPVEVNVDRLEAFPPEELEEPEEVIGVE